MFRIIRYSFAITLIICVHAFPTIKKANNVIKQETEEFIEYVLDGQTERRKAVFNKRLNSYTGIFYRLWHDAKELNEQDAHKLFIELEDKYNDILKLNDPKHFPPLETDDERRLKSQWNRMINGLKRADL